MRVALLRGINVGRAKRIAMADLRALVEALGYRDVRTLLNSGNIVFHVPTTVRGDPASRIEHAIAERLDVSTRVTVLTARDVATALAENPLADVADNPSRMLVLVPADSTVRGHLVPLLKQRWAPDALALGSRVAYLWCPGGIADSPLMAAVARLTGDGTTARNMTTMARIHALMRAE